jgi:mannose-6-phosphate isomerase-like protein (cupin superfamily)
MIESIIHNGISLAFIIRASYQADGVKFFTPDSYSQQLAYMHHEPGHKIMPHVHNPVSRDVQYTQEVLIIRKGKLRVDFYDNEQNYLESHILNGGDVILLASGGHGFEVLEELEMIEVKQGPYLGEQDKTRFKGIVANDVRSAKQ